jgi:hypothetical protein
MSNNTLSQLKDVPGVLNCRLEHEVSKTTAFYDWHGPKLNDIWPSVLAFFKWTYDKYQSESQVRLYVSPDRWYAWAYPQEAGTGMITKEIHGPAASKQREQFGSLLPFGTAHHHNNVTAFQSSIDEKDENKQTGLHLTVGNLAEAEYDIHARLYISGFKFEPDLSWFWEVDLLQDLPPELRELLNKDAAHTLAKKQMGIPPPKEIEFPDQWRDNIIEVEKPKTVGIQYNYSDGYCGSTWRGFGAQKKAWDLARDMALSATELRIAWDKYKMKGSPELFIEKLRNQPLMHELTRILYRNDCSLEGLADYFKYEKPPKQGKLLPE